MKNKHLDHALDKIALKFSSFGVDDEFIHLIKEKMDDSQNGDDFIKSIRELALRKYKS